MSFYTQIAGVFTLYAINMNNVMRIVENKDNTKKSFITFKSGQTVEFNIQVKNISKYIANNSIVLPQYGGIFYKDPTADRFHPYGMKLTIPKFLVNYVVIELENQDKHGTDCKVYFINNKTYEIFYLDNRNHKLVKLFHKSIFNKFEYNHKKEWYIPSNNIYIET